MDKQTGTSVDYLGQMRLQRRDWEAAAAQVAHAYMMKKDG